MLFKLTADAEFEADNIDDAFIKLSRHFLELYHASLFEELNGSGLLIGGRIGVERVIERREEQHDASNSM